MRWVCKTLLESGPNQRLTSSREPWLRTPWSTVDDRVRGGASQSFLTSLPNEAVRFHGHLDTSTLGGAGFASQFSPLEAAPQAFDPSISSGNDRRWDLSAWDGIEIDISKSDGKVYTLIFKDEVLADKREDGREKAGINWEVDIEMAGNRISAEKDENSEAKKVFVPWNEFKATYRGKPKDDTEGLKTASIRRVGLMMRSYFGRQEGDFSLDLKSLAARKTPPNYKTPNLEGEVGHGWTGWFYDLCTVS